MNAITSHSMQQIAIANRRAESEDIDRKQAQYKQFALADLVKSLQKSDKVAADMGDEFLSKVTPEEMGAIFRLAFAGDTATLHVKLLEVGMQSLENLAELEAYRAFN